MAKIIIVRPPLDDLGTGDNAALAWLADQGMTFEPEGARWQTDDVPGQGRNTREIGFYLTQKQVLNRLLEKGSWFHRWWMHNGPTETLYVGEGWFEYL